MKDPPLRLLPHLRHAVIEREVCVCRRQNPTGSLEVNSGPHGRNIYTAREGRFARRHAVRYMYEMLLLHMCMKRYVVLSADFFGWMPCRPMRCSQTAVLSSSYLPRGKEKRDLPVFHRVGQPGAQQRGGIPSDAETPSENSLGGRGKDILVHCSRGK